MRPLAAAVLLSSTFLPHATAAQGLADACEAITGYSVPDTTITASEYLNTEGVAPVHCIVHGIVEPRIGKGGTDPTSPSKTYGSGFELRLPEAWNGRFLFQGGGGLDGWISPAVGIVDRSRPEDTALSRGYAVVSTDTGHTGRDNTDASFGVDEQARIDNAYNSVDIVTVAAKAITTQAYGREPDWSYFQGCSNGGRQGMIAAFRYPGHFDGIVAGAPAKDLVRAVTAWNWNTRALMQAAPKDGNGDPIVSEAFSDDELELLQGAAIHACDAADGLEDGLIEDVTCRFDPSVLTCTDEAGENCLSEAQVEAARAIYQGPTNSSGAAAYGGLMPGAETGPGGWRSWLLGDSETGTPDSRIYLYQQDWLRYLAFPEPRPEMNPIVDFNLDEDWKQIQGSAELWSADHTDYAAFRERGGKMIVWHGTGDPAFSGYELMHWHDRIADQHGGADAAGEFARLFFVPGVHHCGGGHGPASFDPLQAIVDWVENEEAPDSLVATSPSGTPHEGRSRLLCPYPQQSRYQGEGDVEDAASFECLRP